MAKKTKYPNTYDECAALMDITWQWHRPLESEGKDDRKPYERKLDYKLARLKQLLICRDAYWKIAGEELGLGKPWEPDFRGVITSYVITVESNKILKSWTTKKQVILAFPTEEMRDAFYENFKDLINECKELL